MQISRQSGPPLLVSLDAGIQPAPSFPTPLVIALSWTAQHELRKSQSYMYVNLLYVLTLYVDRGGFFHSLHETQSLSLDLIRYLCWSIKTHRKKSMTKSVPLVKALNNPSCSWRCRSIKFAMNSISMDNAALEMYWLGIIMRDLLEDLWDSLFMATSSPSTEVCKTAKPWSLACIVRRDWFMACRTPEPPLATPPGCWELQPRYWESCSMFIAKLFIWDVPLLTNASSHWRIKSANTQRCHRLALTVLSSFRYRTLSACCWLWRIPWPLFSSNNVLIFANWRWRMTLRI